MIKQKRKSTRRLEDETRPTWFPRWRRSRRRGSNERGVTRRCWTEKTSRKGNTSSRSTRWKTNLFCRASNVAVRLVDNGTIYIKHTAKLNSRRVGNALLSSEVPAYRRGSRNNATRSSPPERAALLFRATTRAVLGCPRPRRELLRKNRLYIYNPE